MLMHTEFKVQEIFPSRLTNLVTNSCCALVCVLTLKMSREIALVFFRGAATTIYTWLVLTHFRQLGLPTLYIGKVKFMYCLLITFRGFQTEMG